MCLQLAVFIIIYYGISQTKFFIFFRINMSVLILRLVNWLNGDVGYNDKNEE